MFIQIKVNHNTSFKRITLSFVYFWQVIFFWAVTLHITKSIIENILQTLSKAGFPLVAEAKRLFSRRKFSIKEKDRARRHKFKWFHCEINFSPYIVKWQGTYRKDKHEIGFKCYTCATSKKIQGNTKKDFG